MTTFFCSAHLKLIRNDEVIQSFSSFDKKQIISICRHETKSKTVFFIITRKIIYKVSSNVKIFFDVNIENTFFKPWTEMCSLVFEKKLCLIGGSKDVKPQRTFQITSLKEPKFLLGPALNTARVRPAACVSGNFIYVAGGWALSNVNSVERFNGDFWVTLDFSFGIFRNLALVSFSPARIFILAGDDKNEVFQVNLNKKNVEFLKKINSFQDFSGFNVCFEQESLACFSNWKTCKERVVESRWDEREIFLILRERLSLKLL